MLNDESMIDVELINPVHEYIAPELIELYVTNIGSFQPSHIYRLLVEYYHDDYWISFGIHFFCRSINILDSLAGNECW